MIPAENAGAVKWLSLAGLLIVAAAVLLWVGTNSVQVANEGRAEPAGDGRVRRGGAPVRRLHQLPRSAGEQHAGAARGARDCAVAHAGDPQATLDGARQGSRTISDTATSVGSFDGRAGRLSVRCDWDGRRPLGATNRFIVARQRTLSRNVSYAGFGLGGVLVIVGLLMIRRTARRS